MMNLTSPSCVFVMLFSLFFGIDLMAQNGTLTAFSKKELKISDQNTLLTHFGGLPDINTDFFRDYAVAAKFFEDAEGKVYYRQDSSAYIISEPGRGEVVKFDPDLVKRSNWITTEQRKVFKLACPHSGPIQDFCMDSLSQLWIISSNRISKCDGKKWTSYDANDGLKDKRYQSVMTGSDGAVWVRGESSVSRFADNQWEHYNHKNGLPQRILKGLLETPDGGIWVITNSKGIARFDGEKWTTFNGQSGLAHNYTSTARVDSKGRLWVISHQHGITLLDNQRWIIFNKKTGFPTNSFIKLEEDRQGNMWAFFVDKGVGKYTNGAWTFFTTNEGLLDNQIQRFSEDEYGNIWLASENGITLYQNGTMQGYKVRPLANLRTFKDSEEKIWLYSAQGLLLYDGKTIKDYSTFLDFPKQVYHIVGKRELFKKSRVRLFEDSKGRIWFTRYSLLLNDSELLVVSVEQYEEEGVAAFSSDKNQWEVLSRNDGFVDKRIFSIFEDSKGNIWLDSPGTIYRYSD
jgi:ligand-binding sensor domain-containing protein